MVEFARRWPDMRLWAISRGKTAPLVVSGTVKVSAERDDNLPSQVVISVVPAQLETAVSRQFIVTVEAWAPSKQDGFDLCQDVVYTIGDSLRIGPFIRLVGSAGPNERRDAAGSYYYSATVTVTAGPA